MAQVQVIMAAISKVAHRLWVDGFSYLFSWESILANVFQGTSSIEFVCGVAFLLEGQIDDDANVEHLQRAGSRRELPVHAA